MDTLNVPNERVDAFVGTSSFDTPAAANDQAPIDVPAEVHEDIVASVDFSEVELADEFTEPQVAVTPNGLLPMEPLPIDGRLRKAALRMPDEIEEASGFTLFGRRIKSLIYTTDVAVIRNSNADAVFAVYPFTPQPAITQALLTVAECPVFVGVGGGTTTGKRSVQMAAVSEMQGAAGCVVNSPPPPKWSSTSLTLPTSPSSVRSFAATTMPTPRCALEPRFSTSPPARTRPRSYASCASTIPTCRSSRRAARRPRASVKPSPPA